MLRSCFRAGKVVVEKKHVAVVYLGTSAVGVFVLGASPLLFRISNKYKD